MGTIQIEVAQFDDQGKIGPLIQSIYGLAMQDEYDAAQVVRVVVGTVEDEVMAADDFYFSTADLMNCCIVARDDDELVGVACVNPYTCELHFLGVRESHRRQGIGRQLFEAVQYELRRRGMDHVQMDVKHHATLAGSDAFMKALGWKEVSTSTRWGYAVDGAGQRDQYQEDEEEGEDE